MIFFALDPGKRYGQSGLSGIWVLDTVQYSKHKELNCEKKLYAVKISLKYILLKTMKSSGYY